MENIFHEILKEICDEMGITYTFLSKDWIVMLEKDGVRRFISGYKFDTTRHGFGEMIDDKYAMYDVLSTLGIPIIKHHIVYFENNHNDYAIGCNTYEYLLDLFHEYHSNIVIKENSGSCGLGVFHITSEDELATRYQKIRNKYFSFSVCPYIDIKNEYRCIVVDNKIQLIYKKIRPIVVGDGNSSIGQLLKKFNPRYFENYQNDEILKKGEVFEYDWRFNLSRGSVSSLDILDNDRTHISDFINNLNIDIPFGSVDIVKTTDNEYLLMEINSGVMMDNFIHQHENGREIAKDIYKKAILEMFK